MEGEDDGGDENDQHDGVRRLPTAESKVAKGGIRWNFVKVGWHRRSRPMLCPEKATLTFTAIAEAASAQPRPTKRGALEGVRGVRPLAPA